MSFVHAIALFLFASRAFYGLPTIIYYQAEMAAVLIYILLAAMTSAPAAKHFRFLVFTAFLFTAVFISAIQAHNNFDQPLILGMLSRRDLFVSVIPAYFLIYSLGSRKTERVVRKFIILTKFYVVSALVLTLTIDPATLNNALSGNDQLRLYFVDFSASLAAYRLKLSPLPGFLFLIYFFSDRPKSRSDPYVLIMFYVWLALFFGGRIAIASTIIFYVALALKSVRTKSGFVKVSLTVPLLLILVISGLMLVPEAALESRLAGLSQAFNAINLVDSSHLSDVSSLSRVSQYLQLNSRLDMIGYFFGLGQLSTQWNDGFESIFGRFHPSDLGVYGFLGIFGVVGLTILLMALWIVFPARITRNKNFRPLLVFLVVYSIPTGLILFQIPMVLISFLILSSTRQNFQAVTASTKEFRTSSVDKRPWK